MNLLERAKKAQLVIEKVNTLYNDLVPSHRSMAEIARAVGVSKSRVYQILHPKKRKR